VIIAANFFPLFSSLRFPARFLPFPILLTQNLLAQGYTCWLYRSFAKRSKLPSRVRSEAIATETFLCIFGSTIAPIKFFLLRGSVSNLCEKIKMCEIKLRRAEKRVLTENPWDPREMHETWQGFVFMDRTRNDSAIRFRHPYDLERYRLGLRCSGIPIH